MSNSFPNSVRTSMLSVHIRPTFRDLVSNRHWHTMASCSPGCKPISYREPRKGSGVRANIYATTNIRLVCDPDYFRSLRGERQQRHPHTIRKKGISVLASSGASTCLAVSFLLGQDLPTAPGSKSSSNWDSIVFFTLCNDLHGYLKF